MVDFFMNKIKIKINGLFIRTVDIIRLLPIRVWRVILHIYKGIFGIYKPVENYLPMNRFARWWLELFFYLLDIIGVPEIYETLMDWAKWDTRPLTDAEIKMAESVYGNSIPSKRVRVDRAAKIVCRKHHIYYVSFYTINSWGSFRDDIFIHELMHVWQFRKMGSIYIPRALLAQWTLFGYNYGGIRPLKIAIENKEGFAPFNLEQQADIVSDYFCLREGLMPRWVSPMEGDLLPVYEYFIRILRD